MAASHQQSPTATVAIAIAPPSHPRLDTSAFSFLFLNNCILLRRRDFAKPLPVSKIRHYGLKRSRLSKSASGRVRPHRAQRHSMSSHVACQSRKGVQNESQRRPTPPASHRSARCRILSCHPSLIAVASSFLGLDSTPMAHSLADVDLSSTAIRRNNVVCDKVSVLNHCRGFTRVVDALLTIWNSLITSTALQVKMEVGMAAWSKIPPSYLSAAACRCSLLREALGHHILDHWT
jgi:hypothetical protein